MLLAPGTPVAELSSHPICRDEEAEAQTGSQRSAAQVASECVSGALGASMWLRLRLSRPDRHVGVPLQPTEEVWGECPRLLQGVVALGVRGHSRDRWRGARSTGAGGRGGRKAGSGGAGPQTALRRRLRRRQAAALALAKGLPPPSLCTGTLQVSSVKCHSHLTGPERTSSVHTSAECYFWDGNSGWGT